MGLYPLQADQEEVQRKMRSDQLKKMQATPIYQNILKDMDEKMLEELDPETLLMEQVREILSLSLFCSL